MAQREAICRISSHAVADFAILDLLVAAAGVAAVVSPLALLVLLVSAMKSDIRCIIGSMLHMADGGMCRGNKYCRSMYLWADSFDVDAAAR